MKTIKEAFGHNLRILRGSRSQAKMAELLELSERNYQRMEKGKVFPQEATLQQITSKLDVSEVSLVQLPGETSLSASSSGLEILRELLTSVTSIVTTPAGREIVTMLGSLAARDEAKLRNVRTAISAIQDVGDLSAIAETERLRSNKNKQS